MMYSEKPHAINTEQPAKTPRPRRPGLVLTDRAMQSVAIERPPMGGGFPKRLVKQAGRLEISHTREGQVFFALFDRAGSWLAERCLAAGPVAVPG